LNPLIMIVPVVLMGLGIIFLSFPEQLAKSNRGLLESIGRRDTDKAAKNSTKIEAQVTGWILLFFGILSFVLGTLPRLMA
jgi:hypothetical protein